MVKPNALIWISLTAIGMASLAGCTAQPPEEKALEAIKNEILASVADAGISEADVAGIRCHDPVRPEEEAYIGDEVDDSTTDGSFSLRAECTLRDKSKEYLSYDCVASFPTANSATHDVGTDCRNLSNFLGKEVFGVEFDGDTFYRNAPNQVFSG